MENLDTFKLSTIVRLPGLRKKSKIFTYTNISTRIKNPVGRSVTLSNF